MIRSIRLKNWRSHLDTKLTFSPGTNALLGPIGSGKTSVLDAICFALFGTFPVLQAKKIKLDDVISAKPILRDKAEVELEFEFNQKSYAIKRVIERGKGTTYSEIREDGKLLEAPNSSRVTEIVEKILKVNYELFTKAVYSEQNALDYFLTIPKGQRKKRFDELLMLDRFEDARANTVTLINRISERKVGIQSAIEKVNVEELEKNLEELKTSLKKIFEEREALEKSFREISERKHFLEGEVERARKLKEEVEKLERRASGIESAISEVLASIRALEEDLRGKHIEKLEERLKEVKEKIANLEIELKNKNIEFRRFSSLEAEHRAKLEDLQRDVARLEREVSEKLRVKKDFERYREAIKVDIEKELAEKRKTYEKLVGQLEALKFQVNETRALLQQLTQVKGKCPLCQTRLTRAKAKILVQHREQHLKALAEEQRKILAEKEKAEQELKKAEEMKKRWDEMKIELRDLEQRQEELRKQKEMEEKIREQWLKVKAVSENLGKEVLEAETKLKENVALKEELEILATKFRDYGSKQARLALLMRERENLEKELEKVKSMLAEKRLEELESELRAVIAKEKECEINIQRCKDLAKEREERVSELEKQLKEIRKQKEEVRELERLLRELGLFKQALVATQLELREELIGAINHYMAKIWSTLYPYRDFIGIRLTVEEDDYTLQLQERSGRFINADGVASGGERSLACLALRIAFSTVLAPQLRWLVLDEPTHNLDLRAVEVLAQTLRERIGEIADQVFIISHDEKLEEAITGASYRLERDKATDGYTKVKEITI